MLRWRQYVSRKRWYLPKFEQRYNPEDHSLHLYRRENLKSYVLPYLLIILVYSLLIFMLLRDAPNVAAERLTLMMIRIREDPG
jgi:hypothetical protein